MSLFNALGQNNLITYFTLFLNQHFKKAQSILLIYEFHICEFTYLLKCIHNLTINTWGILVVIYRHAQSGAQFELPAELVEGDALPCCFYLCTINKCSVRRPCNAAFFRFLWVTLLFDKAPCPVLSAICVRKCRAVMCLMEEICARRAFVQADLQCCWPWVPCEQISNIPGVPKKCVFIFWHLLYIH